MGYIKTSSFEVLKDANGEEYVIGVYNKKNIKIKLSSLKVYFGISATGNILPTKAPSFNLGAPEEPKLYIGGAGTYTLDGVETVLEEPINFFFWNEENWDVLEIPVDINADGEVELGDNRPVSGDEAFKKTLTKEEAQEKTKPFMFVDTQHLFDVRDVVKDFSVFIYTYNNQAFYKPDGEMRRFQIYNINPTTNRVYIGRENDAGQMVEYMMIDIVDGTGSASTNGFTLSVKVGTLQAYSSSSYAGFSPNFLNENVFLAAIEKHKNFNDLRVETPAPSDPDPTSYTRILSENGTYASGAKVIDSIVVENVDVLKGNRREKVLGVFKEIFKYPTRIGKGAYTFGATPQGILLEIKVARAIQDISFENADNSAEYKISWFNANPSTFMFIFYITKIKDGIATNFIFNATTLPDFDGVKTFTATNGQEKITASVDMAIASEINLYSETQVYYLEPDVSSSNRVFTEGNLIFSSFATKTDLSLSSPSPTDPATNSYVNILSENGTYTNGTRVNDAIVFESKKPNTPTKTTKVLGVFKDFLKYPTRIGKGAYTYGANPSAIRNEFKISRSIKFVNVENGDVEAEYKISWVNLNLVSGAFNLWVTKIKDGTLTNFTLNSGLAPTSGIVKYSATADGEIVSITVDMDELSILEPGAASATYYLEPNIPASTRVFTEGNLILSASVITTAVGQTGNKTHIYDNLSTDNVLNSNVILGSYGAEDTIYKIPLKTTNNIFRVRFEVKINESMTRVNGRRDIMNFINGNNSLGIVGYSSDVVSNARYQQSNSGTTALTNQVIENLAGLGYHNPTEGFKLTTRRYPFYNPLYGSDVMWIRYKYDGVDNALTDVCLSILGTEFRLYRSSDNSTLASFDLGTYTEVYDLVEAIKGLSYMEADFLNNSNTSELINCEDIELVSEYYAGDNNDPQPFMDAAKLYIPLEINDTWHTVEVVSNGGAIYVSWDGVTQKVAAQTPSMFNGGDIYIGGNSSAITVKNQIKNIEINFDNTGDAEVFERKFNNSANDVPIIVSNMHPHIKAYMAHHIFDGKDVDTPNHSSTFISSDRLEQMFKKLIEKGYTPITVEDIADFYANKKDLPKRAFTIIWDDYRFQNWTNYKFRSLQLKYGVRSCWAWITDWDNPITDSNGNVIEKDKFIQSLKDGGMSIQTHTKEHRYIYRGLQSELEQEYQADILSAINNGVGSDIMMYPFGGINPNVIKAADHNFRAGFYITYAGRYMTKASPKTNIIRERAEVSSSLQLVLDNII